MTDIEEIELKEPTAEDEELETPPTEVTVEKTKEQKFHDEYIESITHKSEEDEVEIDW